MRLVDFIFAVNEASHRLSLRGEYLNGLVAEMTLKTMPRQDLVDYLSASIGTNIPLPADRLSAMILRMAEIVNDGLSGSFVVLPHRLHLIKPLREDPSRRRTFHMAPDGSNAQSEVLTQAANTFFQTVGPPCFFGLLADQSIAIAPILEFVLQAPRSTAAAIVLAPWSDLEPFSDMWMTSRSLAYGGPVFYDGRNILGCMYTSSTLAT